MKKVLSILGLLLIIGLSIIPAAVNQVVFPRGVYGEPVGTDTRISQTTTTKLVSVNNGIGSYQATISTLPETLPDLRTKISCTWTKSVGEDGVSVYTTGNNLFLGKVVGNRASAEFDSTVAAWSPTVWIGSEELKLSTGPVLIDDRLNDSYKNNTLKWTYSGQVGGWFFGIFGKKTITVTRYLRQIEGSLQEEYVLDKYPGNSVTIKQNYEAESGYDYAVDAFAFDADGKSIEVTTSGDHKSLSSDSIKDATYPVTIDPTSNFTGSTADCWLAGGNSVYATARATATGGSPQSGTLIYAEQIGQYYAPGDQDYFIERGYLLFDTSTLPDDAILSSAVLDFRPAWIGDYDGQTFSAVLQTGSATYPHNPVVAADFNQSYYSGNGGSYASSSMITGQYNQLLLNSTGLSWISKIDYTKFCIRTDGDINGTAPGLFTNGDDYRVGFNFYSAEQGTGYAPYLVVDYTLPITVPSIVTNDASDTGETSTTFNGYITSDGGQSVSIGFNYGLSSPPTSGTPTYSGYVTGQYFSYLQSGLSRGTLYYFKAIGINTAGTGSGSIKTFLTKPAIPSSLTITPDDIHNDLAWTKGNGSDNTLIVRKTGSYPTTITDGTQIYNNTGTSYADTSLTNGVTYYYSAWSIAAEGGLTQYSSSYTSGYGKPYTLTVAAATTNDASMVTSAAARLNADLTDMGGYATVDMHFDYGETTEYGTTTADVAKTSVGAYYLDISGLEAAHLYHFRVGVTNGTGVYHGADDNFTTGAGSAPTMLTDNATGVALSQATLNGEVVNYGGTAVTVWFQWGLTTGYGNTSDSASGQGTGDTFYFSLTGLLPSTTYHFRAVGQNTAGITYGLDENFTTSAPVAPQVSTGVASAIGATSATLQGKLDYDGGVDCDVRFDWGTSDNWAAATATGLQPGFGSGETFSAYIDGLTTGTTYYFRAVAFNTTDNDTGSSATFITVFTEPTNFQAKTLSGSTIGVSWAKVGDQTGVYMKKGSYPIDRLDGEQVYFGSSTGFTASGLTNGCTYFFRAWSWKAGGTWSTTYAEDAATTGSSSGTTGEPDSPGADIVGPEPGTPGNWWLVPTGDGLLEFPFHATIETAATSIGIPSSGMWALIGVLIVCVFGLFAGILVKGNLFILGGVLVLAMAFTSTLGLLPLWVAILSLVAYLGYYWSTSKG